MKRCPCRTARPFGPSTRRSLRATELLGGQTWACPAVATCAPRCPPTLSVCDLSSKQRFPGPYLFTYFLEENQN